ncbi:centrosomal protein of 290 kDa [Diabrotica virgifera virgifera]|uniref:Centrosomal protein of 290 kDa-like n=1 Tax=Diabrotica virgifera virgifera TaxID=50390 RepID=A0ABM5JRS8_DIAVI|nr:centrosomal protein of 290 kDa [Diabrotica virgifera virgifera]
MDWKYLLSVDLEELNDDEKDDLYNSVTWFDVDSENLDDKRYKVLVRTCQEILKYKGEQVETLLHELEEMAIKQAEEEARRQESEADVKSSKSKKSSSLEYENLEHKYLELKAKHKKAVKINEKHESELTKLNNKLKVVEQENKRLQNELQTMPHDAGSESDYSESIRDRQKELVETLHNKNTQISDLLRDIEEVEQENIVLREKFTKVKDELSSVTKDLEKLKDLLSEKDEEIKDQAGNINKINQEYEELKKTFETCQKEKLLTEKKLNETIEDLNKQVAEFKEQLHAKNEEIENLKLRLKEPSLNSSLSSLPKDDPEPSQTLILQKSLNDKDQQLRKLTDVVSRFKKEKDDFTDIIHKLKAQKKAGQQKLTGVQENVEELKKQLKTVHERCQKLHDDLVFAEKNARCKDEELKDLVKQLHEEGKDELAVNIQTLSELKSENRSKEKQIISLVKATNKLQDVSDILEKENCCLREIVGLSEEDQVNLSSYTSKQRKLKKENDHLKHQMMNKEESILQLKTELQKLNRANASLTSQILELGHKPLHESKVSAPTIDFDSKEDNKALVEENEALRKGLHEVMSCINDKKTHLEIKSETFEKLLRALDVKHITGWYHPAMRLQAEVHNLEGINSELREQLRLARKENKSAKVFSKTEEIHDVEKDDVDCVTSDSGIQTEELSSDNLEGSVNALFAKNKATKGRDLEMIQQKVSAWLKQILSSKIELQETLQSTQKKFDNLKDEHELVLEKLKILISETDEEKVKKINEVIGSNVTLNRKVVYLENESKKLVGKIELLENDFKVKETIYLKNIQNIENDKKTLESRLNVEKNLNSTSISFDNYKDMQNNLNRMTAKYRELAATIQRQEEDISLEYTILLETQKYLESDKEELTKKLVTLMSNHTLVEIRGTDDKIEKLSQKLAEAEVREINERQRANHINNLYKLVKEQLNKSEEKFKDFSKFNEELLKKNISFQEQLKKMEETICDSIDRLIYEQVKKENSELVKENESLSINLNNIKSELEIEKQSKEFEKTWNNSKEQELLNLKHQIVDLISVSDEKVIIAQLSGDVLQNRKAVEYYKVSANGLNEELKKMNELFQKESKKYQDGFSMAEEREKVLNGKIRQLQSLLNNQKLQFFGYVPIASEETYINNLITVNQQKHETFLALQRAKQVENETAVLKEKLEIELDYLSQQKEMGTDSCKQAYNKMANWMQEKKNFQINEIRLKRQLEFKQSELQHYIERSKLQDEQILKLDQELLQIYKYLDIPDGVTQKSLQVETQETISQKSPTPAPKPRTLKASRSVTVQTENLEPVSSTKVTSEQNHIVNNLKAELLTLQEEVKVKETQLDQLRSKITEQEMTISMFRKQIGDKQSQITFYERHIMDLQNKKAEVASAGAGGDNVNVGTETVSQTQEQIALKNSVKSLQEEIKSKDEQIMKYQTLLKNDRDKHSLAAARLQEELQNLQKQLMEETQKAKNLEETCAKNRPNRAALERYVSQVHALEKHASELHTKLSTLEVQLQSSRQESIRWRTMANDRLTAMEDLRKDLDKQHQSEMVQYKSDIEKLRDLGNDEINTLRQLILRQKGELTGRLDMDIQRLIREKDDKIHEMIVKLRQVKTSKKSEPLESESTSKFCEMESAKDLLSKEHDLLKKRYEQLLMKEKNARDEIRELKAQLLKKPISARSDKSDKSIKDQLQKKVSSLENEIIDLKRNLSEQIAINEAHRVQANEDFEKWKKMKYFQQTAEKLKNKLKERDNEFEKLQQTNTGYRMAIERLEREKRNLENRVKTLKASNLNVNANAELEILRNENIKLLNDVDILKHKLEMQQHHAGALGATMLQEKLEGQERKIAILELSAKGTVEVRAELDRLQTANSNLQKSNLRLEAENLDLKLDLEKSNKEVPHLHQQIQHLENYIDVLKSENSKQQVEVSSDPQASSPETKKVSELERTVFILKRVVEKLQAENKRQVSGKRPLSDRSASADKLKRDHVRLKEQHLECKQRVEQLTKELETTKNALHSLTVSRNENDKSVALSRELSSVKDQLEIKASLLEKVKILLHRAAAKEKALIQEVAELRTEKGLGISPIPEELEGSSSNSEV